MAAVTVETIAEKGNFENVTLNFQDINVCTLENAVNKVFVRKPLCKIWPNGKRDFFVIEKPTTFTLCCLNLADKKEVAKALINVTQRHTVEYIPAGYLKDQPHPLYNVKIDIGFDYSPDVRVIEFGSSYGKITVNGVEFGISHSGCSGYNKELGHYWTDYTQGFEVYTKEPVRFIELILESKNKPRYINK